MVALSDGVETGSRTGQATCTGGSRGKGVGVGRGERTGARRGAHGGAGEVQKHQGKEERNTRKLMTGEGWEVTGETGSEGRWATGCTCSEKN